MPEGSVFMSLDADKLQQNLLHLLCQTARERGRIEIDNCGGGACVLISKEELEALEHALEIMASMDGAKQLAMTIRRYAAMSLSDGPLPQRELQLA